MPTNRILKTKLCNGNAFTVAGLLFFDKKVLDNLSLARQQKVF
jgi:hypothetical protein